MTNYSNNLLTYLRGITSPVNSRPTNVFLVYNKDPNQDNQYSISVTSSAITLSNGSSSFSVTYVSKSSRQISLELSNSPFPLQVLSLIDISSIGTNELRASGGILSTGFDTEDRTLDGKGAYIRIIRYTASYSKVSAIGLSAPYYQSASMPWWPRISIGDFSQSYKGISYHFSIPEYDQQPWSTNFGKPFIDIEGEPVNLITKNSIKLSRSLIFYKNNIFIYPSGGSEPLTDPIKDVDTINGIVYLKDGTQLPKEAIIDYTYLENSYQYKHIDVNGHFSRNPYVLDKYIVFYILPRKSSSGASRLRTVFHSIGSSIDDAIFNIQIENALEPIAILGAINVRPSISSEQINVTDTRSFGGGLRSDSLGIATEKRFKESQYFFDISRKEGIPYPGAASVVIDVPSYLKEVLSISEIRDKIKRNIAGGVYPIIRFQDSEYPQLFTSTEYNSDISLLDYSLSGSNTGQSYFGESGHSSSIFNTSIALPVSGIYYTGYYNQIQYDAPAHSNGITVLQPGNQYKIPYLKGSADAIFSYEERSKDSEWSRVTHINNVTIPTGQLSTQYILIDTSHGYKEIRSLTGLSSYVPSTTLWSDLALEITRIAYLNSQLFSTGNVVYQTGKYLDVFSGELASNTGYIGVSNLVSPILNNYNVCLSKNLLSGLDLASGTAKYIYDSTSGSSFPKMYNGTSIANSYSGTYNALDDIIACSKYTQSIINNITDNNAGVQPINLVGSWLASSSPVAGYSLTGAARIASKVLSLDSFSPIGTINSDIITPFYNPLSNAKIDLWTGQVTEVTSLNNVHFGSQYIKAFASLYASLPCPVSGLLTGTPVISLGFDPKNIALSGIGYWITFFNNYFVATNDNAIIDLSWLATFNKVSLLSSNTFNNLCDAIDSLYYGNNAWAGWTGLSKTGTYYDATNNPNPNCLKDNTWTGSINWPDLTVASCSDTLVKAISGVCRIQQTVAPYIIAQSELGGIMPPGYAGAVKKYLWYPIHKAKEDPLFTGMSFNSQDYVNVFEKGMSAVLKGSFNSDGIISEGGSYAFAPAPFTGSVPSELLDACADAISYYRLSDNSVKELQWQSIAEGIFRTTVSQYAKAYGYPYSLIFTGYASGDPGSIPLRGYLRLLSTYTGQFTSEESTYFTGEAPYLR